MKQLRLPLRELEGKKNLIGCEIGVYKGENAIIILELLDIKLLYLIDPYPNPETTDYMWFEGRNAEAQAAKKQAIEYLKTYTDKGNAQWMFCRSDEAHVMIPDNSLDFIYIDGDHRTEYCLSDINLYLPKLKEGGLMSGHDYNASTVRSAVDEFSKTHSKYKLVKERWDWWFIK